MLIEMAMFNIGRQELSRCNMVKLDANEKGVHTMDTLGGNQEMSIINEGDFIYW